MEVYAYKSRVSKQISSQQMSVLVWALSMPLMLVTTHNHCINKCLLVTSHNTLEALQQTFTDTSLNIKIISTVFVIIVIATYSR